MVSERPSANGCWTSGLSRLTSSPGMGPPGSGESTADMTAGFSTSASIRIQKPFTPVAATRASATEVNSSTSFVNSCESGMSSTLNADKAPCPCQPIPVSRRPRSATSHPSTSGERPARRASGDLPRPTASARHMLETEPVLDSSGVAKSACASTYARPMRPAAARRAPSRHPRTMLQSPPRTTTNRPYAAPAATRSASDREYTTTSSSFRARFGGRT